MHSWNIAIGNFFFRYRNVLFPLIFAVGALTIRPKIMFDSVVADRILVTTGLIVALLGQAVRLITIGFEYIHRGGKDGQVYAGRLVRGGVYGITRNPMYVGNGMIAIGMTMHFGSPLGYIILIPFFLFVYQAIVAAEETYLRNKFGDEYDDYERSVNRYVPALSRVRESFAGMRFDWRRSIKKDLGTVVGLIIGLIMLPVWRAYFLYGLEATKAAAMRALWLTLGITALYLFLLKLKKSDRLFKTSTTPEKS
ncbi:MAG: isoprenylcysteine carboxylmethyltransferase family protein [Deltaproteobacteria bacterium]|nr:isoprenylcysteine carboxylmethyltransferase family protein [Deltaproteobacteria bacterium]